MKLIGFIMKVINLIVITCVTAKASNILAIGAWRVLFINGPGFIIIIDLVVVMSRSMYQQWRGGTSPSWMRFLAAWMVEVRNVGRDRDRGGPPDNDRVCSLRRAPDGSDMRKRQRLGLIFAGKLSLVNPGVRNGRNRSEA